MLGRRFVAAFLACLMVFMLTTPAWAQDAYMAQIEGRAAGEQHRTAAGVWSFAWGFLFGLIGAGASVLYYVVQTPEPDNFTLLELADKSSEYRLTYLRAYGDAARKKQVLQSAVGGGLGVAAAVLFTAAVYSADDGYMQAPVLSVAW